MKRVTSKKSAEDQSAAPPAALPASPASPAVPDVALIHGLTPDGEGLKILRARGDRLELGAVRPLREGAPITGEVVTLRPRANFPALCDVETHFKPPEPASDRPESAPAAVAQRTGPAQVATDEYRRNWDAIWNRPDAKSKLSN
ncbi:MAG TPA: hypothetical protein VER12_10075 [Polyangiaceae bacterium]|nr:hypothetical protein [Polyangiaceae bacterium]